MGISRAQRLKRRSEFAAVYEHGKLFRNEFVVLRTLRTNFGVSRVGLTAGRALGGAVVRNRVKRRMREIVRVLPIIEGWDAVLNARSIAARAAHDELAGGIRALMDRAGLLG